ncbi:MAG: hypothetical protein V7746_26035 [Halioglobus sp.]
MSLYLNRSFYSALALALFASCPWAFGQEDEEAAENPSNPLSKSRNTDLRAQYFDLGDNADRSSYNVEGATMLNSQLKLKYEARYWSTNVTGKREHGMEAASLKAIYFPKDRQLSDEWGVRPAIGLEWIIDFDNVDKGIGGGSDILSPFLGLAFAHSSGLSLVPLVQHFTEYSGNKVKLTAFRLIGIQPLDGGYWLKLDAKVPIDWENDRAIPASAEFQLGRMFSPGLGGYIDAFAGMGSDRPYDWGLGLGLRFVY